MVKENTASTVLSTIGTVIWCVQLIPQIYFLHKRKNAEGFPPIFMALWCISGVFMAIYFIISDSYIPLQLQPHLFTVLCSVAWFQSMYYPPNEYGRLKILAIATTFYGLWTGLEVGFSVWLRPVYSKGTKWPDLIFGIIATVFLTIGLLPPYFELAKRKGRVVGINFVFLAMDSSGAVFSMVAMIIGTFDVMGMILYAMVIVLEAGLFLSQVIWLLRFGRENSDDTHLDLESVYDMEFKRVDDSGRYTDCDCE